MKKNWKLILGITVVVLMLVGMTLGIGPGEADYKLPDDCADCADFLGLFYRLASWVTYILFALKPGEPLANAVHFWVMDITKIFTLLVIMIYIISFIRASLNTEVVRDYLMKRHRLMGYTMAAFFGAITPFCSCSSIPLFLGFTAARIPVGITMSFLITSPMINEVAVTLLGTNNKMGMTFTLIYVGIGIASGIIGGAFFDFIGAEKMLQPAFANLPEVAVQEHEKKHLGYKARHIFAKAEVKSIFGRIWKWIVLGVTLGAALHGYVPQEVIIDNLGDGQWWSVPGAVLLGIPLYANVSGVIPVVESLIDKGLPIGTSMAFMMSVVGASFPEFMMLKQVMKPRMLVIFFLLLLVLFSISGWVLNLVY